MGVRDASGRGVPLALDLDRQKELRIRWTDGHESVYPLEALRRACPCATCRAEREARQRNPLHVLAGSADRRAMTTVDQAELVGRYALRIRWNDGHDTGIYDFQTLRSECPCSACAGAAGRAAR